MLNEQQIYLVKQTIPLLESVSTNLTEHFYKRMFRDNPELKDVFNLSHQHSGKQPVALFNAVAAYAKNIENPSVLKEAVYRIANKHTSFNIQPEHYDIVGHHLIATLNELAGDAFTPEIEDAWTQAYQVLAGLFIDIEKDLYVDSQKAEGGWEGARRFRLIEKRIESELVKSLVFQPLDKKPVKDFFPGQYLGLKLNIPNHEHQEIRQYSLSARPNGSTYQISVKREVVGVPGIVSNYLHDGLRLGEEVDIYAPAGDFYFEDRQRPVSLISAGVGLTPMTAILEKLVHNQFPHTVQFIHACENLEQHSFKDKVQIATQKKNIESYTWYKSDHVKEPYVFHGFLDLTLIEENLPLEDGDFYLCGPVPFMQFAKQQLKTLGVETNRIHYEVFGPHEDF